MGRRAVANGAEGQPWAGRLSQASLRQASRQLSAGQRF
jgi:hypothetical protein